MKQPAVTEGCVGWLRDRATRTRDQRVGDGAAFSWQNGGDARANGLAQVLQEFRPTNRQRLPRSRGRRSRRRFNLGFRQRIAGGAQALKPGRARKIKITRQGWRRWRTDFGFQPDGITWFQPGRRHHGTHARAQRKFGRINTLD